jgi:hypothetical protein
LKYILLASTLLAILSLVACAVPPTQTAAANIATDSPVAASLITTTSNPTSANQEAEIKELVENFGKRLQVVSLQAPDAAQELQKQYSEFVSPVLLEIWLNDVSKAPGRMVSSPWPDRIEITALSSEGFDRYEITGFIVETTSTEIGTGEAAARIPIRLVVQRAQGGWLITEYAEER